MYRRNENHFVGGIMANELSQINKNELAGFVAGQELGNIIKPLVREIHLFDSFVAGTSILMMHQFLRLLRSEIS